MISSSEAAPRNAATFARTAVLGLDVLLEAVVDQRVQVGDTLQDDVAATPAVTAVGSAELDVLHAPEADAAPTAVAALQIDLGFVEELHAASPIGRSPMSWQKRRR